MMPTFTRALARILEAELAAFARKADPLGLGLVTSGLAGWMQQDELPYVVMGWIKVDGFMIAVALASADLVADKSPREVIQQRILDALQTAGKAEEIRA